MDSVWFSPSANSFIQFQTDVWNQPIDIYGSGFCRFLKIIFIIVRK